MTNNQEVIIPSNPEDRAAILSSMKEISNVKTMMEANREFISEELKALGEKYKLPVKFVRKMAAAYHKQTYQQEKQEAEEFEMLYETIVGE